MKVLTDTDIRNLYLEFNTPEHVKRHCLAVTECALKLADALAAADKRIKLDRDLIYGAGMVHDMARIYPSHEVIAADRLSELGYTKEADIVREHMRTMSYHDIENVTEADLLYISDRMVREDTFVGVTARFDQFREKMIRAGKDPDSETSRMNRANAENFASAIEAKTGRSLAEICGE